MGFTPAQIDAMSFWQFDAVCEGFRRANTPPDDRSLTAAEFAALAEMIPVGGIQ